MRIFLYHPEGRARALLRGSAALTGALLLLLAGALPATGQFPGELRAQVVDARSGAPIPGARVEVSGVPAPVLTDGQGRARIGGLRPGETRLRVEGYGYRAAELTVRIRNGESTPLLLSLHPEALPLDGIVARSGLPGGVTLEAGSIAGSGARTLGELLEGVPGVVVRRRGPGGEEEVSLRGGSSDQVLLLVDGVPVADPLTGGVDLSRIPLAGVVRVEVLPGAHGARFGSGALSGVILVTTGRSTRPTVEGDLHTGSLGALGGGVRGGRGPLSVSAHLRTVEGSFPFRQEEFLGGGDHRRRNADLTQGGGSVALDFDARSPIRGDVSRRWGIRGSWDALERGVPGKSFAPSDSARQSQDRLTLSGRWEERRGSKLIRVHLHYLEQDARFRDPAPPFGPPMESETRLSGWGAQGEWEGDGGVPLLDGVRGRWGAGLSVRRWELASGQLAPEALTPRWDGAVAGRFDSDPLPLPGTPTLGVAARLHHDGGGEAWLGAHEVTLALPLRSAVFHLAHRSAFSPPSPGDLFFQEGVGIVPNPHLRAERIPSEVEVGASTHFVVAGVPLLLAAELYTGSVRDLIVWAPDFRFIWSPRNTDVHRRGAELRTEVELPILGIRAGAHWAHTRIEYDRDGERGSQIAYRPRDSGGVFLSWGRAPIRVEFRGRHTGLRYPVPAPINELNAFWSFDALLGGRWEWGGWEWSPLLRVDRLFDDRTPFIYSFPEPGRTLRLELRAGRIPSPS